MKICRTLLIVGVCLSFCSGSDLRASAGWINPVLDFNLISSNRLVEQDGLDLKLEIQQKYFQEFIEALNNFKVYGAGLERTVAKFSKSIQSLNNSGNANLEQCNTEIMKVLQDASIGNLYALRNISDLCNEVLDAWGRPNGGILEGNVQWPGHYYECKEAKSEEISGKWCNSFWGFRYIPYSSVYPIDATLGTCFPSTCSEESIKDILSAFFNTSQPSLPLLEVTCTTPVSEFSLTTTDIIGIIISAVLVIFVAIGTAMDGIMRLKQTSNDDDTSAQPSDKDTKFANVMLCFSAISNGEKLLDMTQRPGAIPVLDGIRFISTTWVILCHSFFFIQYGIDNAAYANRVLRRDPSWMAILNASVSVDTFFFLSGLLVAYLGIKHLHKTKGRMNIPLMYLQRYLRLTPVYAYLILFSIGLYKYTGSGPYWQNNVDSFYYQCKDTWYSNLLYINNLYPATSMCYGVAWYLANDMQFYILSPIFLLLLYKSKVVGYVLIIFVVVASILITGLLTYFSELQPAVIYILLPLQWWYRFFVGGNSELSYEDKFQTDTYTTPWCRIGAYMIGMLTGYILFEYKGKIKMPKVVARLGWILSIALACALLYGPSSYVRDSTNFSIELSTFYESLARPLWTLCLAWVVVACTSGYGGPITAFLNWPVFTPLSRLTYTAYLIHVMVYMWYMNSQESKMHFLTINVVYFYLGTLVISFGCAFVTSLFVEWPLMNLMKIIFPTSRSTPASKTLDNGEKVNANGYHSHEIKKQHPSDERTCESTILDDLDIKMQNGKCSFENGGYQTEVFQKKTSL